MAGLGLSTNQLSGKSVDVGEIVVSMVPLIRRGPTEGTAGGPYGGQYARSNKENLWQYVRQYGTSLGHRSSVPGVRSWSAPLMRLMESRNPYQPSPVSTLAE